MAIVVRGLSTGDAAISSDQVAFLRSLFPALALTPFMVADARRLGGQFRKVLPMLVIRGLLGSAALICYFRAVALIDLSNAALLCYTSPIFAALFAAAFLKEPLTARMVGAFSVAFAGVALVVQPAALLEGRLPPAFAAGTVYALISGAFAGLAYTAVRHLTGICSTPTIVGMFGWVGTLLCAPLAASKWVAPDGLQWLSLVMVAVLASLGQFYMTRGYAIYKTAHASTMNLSVVIFASLLGALVLHEYPGPMQIAGIALTLGGITLIDTRTGTAAADEELTA